MPNTGNLFIASPTNPAAHMGEARVKHGAWVCIGDWPEGKIALDR